MNHLKHLLLICLGLLTCNYSGIAQTENNSSVFNQTKADTVSNESLPIVYVNDSTLKLVDNIQDDSIDQINPRTARPLGISIYGGSPTIIASLALDYFIRPNISIEAGGGLFGIYAGGRYHFYGERKTKKWTAYTGLMFAMYSEQIGTDLMLMAPFGAQYAGKKGFNFAAELMYLFAEYGPAIIPVWFGVKFGYRFKAKK